MEWSTHQAKCLNCGADFPGLYNKYEMLVCKECGEPDVPYFERQVLNKLEVIAYSLSNIEYLLEKLENLSKYV